MTHGSRGAAAAIVDRKALRMRAVPIGMLVRRPSEAFLFTGRSGDTVATDGSSPA